MVAKQYKGEWAVGFRQGASDNDDLIEANRSRRELKNPRARVKEAAMDEAPARERGAKGVTAWCEASRRSSGRSRH